MNIKKKKFEINFHLRIFLKLFVKVSEVKFIKIIKCKLILTLIFAIANSLN